MAFDPCIVIPVFEHAGPLRRVLEALKPLGLPCLVVDDGSGPECAAALEALVGEHASWASLKRHAVNRGKGGAVKTALRWARERGYSHALQVDADGQHDLEAVPRLLGLAREDSEALVCAEPRFGADVPASRLAGRRLTDFWVAVHTLSRDIPDAMCGLRVYPLEAAVGLLDSEALGDRMDFDIEVLVRLHWRGLKLRFLPVKVSYPADGTSNFRAFADNALISRAHTRLFFGMLLRLPRLLRRKLR